MAILSAVLYIVILGALAIGMVVVVIAALFVVPWLLAMSAYGAARDFVKGTHWARKWRMERIRKNVEKRLEELARS